MKTSETVTKIATALAIAQGKFKPLEKNKKNPHFNSKYADLTACFEATAQELSAAGIMKTQGAGKVEGERVVITRLIHSTSGEWIETYMPLFGEFKTMQQFGSALTFGKRYGFSTTVGISAEEDDDGNAAKGKEEQPAPKAENKPSGKPSGSGPTEPQLKRLFAICKKHEWSHEQLKEYIKQAFAIDSTKDLTRDQYNNICDKIVPDGYETAVFNLMGQDEDFPK